MDRRVLILAFVLSLLTCVHSYNPDCDYNCAAMCYRQGLHGHCDSTGSCNCSLCVYRGCRKFCRREYGKVAQCQGAACICLDWD